MLCGAQQDNSTVCIAARTDGIGIGEKDWYDVGGGESGWIAARQDDPDIVFAGSYGGGLTPHDHRPRGGGGGKTWAPKPEGGGGPGLEDIFPWAVSHLLGPPQSHHPLIAPPRPL